MFKMTTSLLLIFLMLFSNIGFAITVHYCGDSIASVSLKSFAEKKCCSMGEKKTGCCSDKVVHFEKKSDNAVVKTFPIQCFPILISKARPEISLRKSNFKSHVFFKYFCDSHAPPLFKQYSQYIFYHYFNV